MPAKRCRSGSPKTVTAAGRGHQALAVLAQGGLYDAAGPEEDPAITTPREVPVDTKTPDGLQLSVEPAGGGPLHLQDARRVRRGRVASSSDREDGKQHRAFFKFG